MLCFRDILPSKFKLSNGHGYAKRGWTDPEIVSSLLGESSRMSLGKEHEGRGSKPQGLSERIFLSFKLCPHADGTVPDPET